MTGLDLRACGDRAVLVELPTPAARRYLDDLLSSAPPDGLVDQVPTLRTLLLRFDAPERLAEAILRLRAIDLDYARPLGQGQFEVVEVPVRYDGADLDSVAGLVGIGPDEVVARHTGQLWTVDFAGFMPGFGYLTGERGGLRVPRLASPRTRIPPGSVALADEFTGIYPQASPGGWQLIGTTDADLWNLDRTPAALLVPGRRIRFVAVR